MPLHGRGPKLRGGLPRPAAGAKGPCPAELPVAGAKGPCPAELPRPAACRRKRPVPAELPRPAACRRKRPMPRGTSSPRRMPTQKDRAPQNTTAAACAKGPCPTELHCRRRRKRPVLRGTPRRMPAQKARAPRNSPPHAGRATSGKEANDSGPCAALTTKITFYRVKKGRRRIFFTSPPETGAAPLSENPSEGSHRNPVRRLAPKPHPKARTGGPPKARAETPSEGPRRGHAPEARRRCGIRPPPQPPNRPERVVKKGPSCRPTPSAKNGAVFIGQRHQQPDY